MEDTPNSPDNSFSQSTASTLYDGLNGLSSADFLALQNTVATTSDTIGFSKIAIGGFYIHHEEEQYKYVPQDDITTQELAHLVILFFYATHGYNNYFSNWAYWSFVTEHQLQRHFVKVQK